HSTTPFPRYSVIVSRGPRRSHPMIEIDHDLPPQRSGLLVSGDDGPDLNDHDPFALAAPCSFFAAKSLRLPGSIWSCSTWTTDTQPSVAGFWIAWSSGWVPQLKTG